MKNLERPTLQQNQICPKFENTYEYKLTSEVTMDLDIEPNLLDSGIAEGSYNFERQSSSRGHDERKLLFRKNPEDHLKDRFKFSKPLQDLEKCQDRCECRECHRTSKYYCGGNYDWLHFFFRLIYSGLSNSYT